MKIWIVEIGEPLPVEKDVRLHRYGQFSQYLAKKGHDVTWWTSSFSHAPKKHFFESDTIHKHNGVELRVLKGLGYGRNVSPARIKHQAHFAKRFLEEAEKASPPDLIISPIPTLEGAQAGVQFALKHKVPVLTDIRDRWPDEFVNIAPKPFRPLAKLLLNSMYKKAHFVCENANGIMGMSDTELNYGLSLARRKMRDTDLFFPLGYDTKVSQQTISSETEAWLQSLNIPDDALVGCYFGTIGRFFDLSTVIKAAKVLEKEFPFRIILAGHGSSLEKFKAEAACVNSVIFPGWINGNQIAAIMRRSSFGLAPYGKGEVFSLPNKPFEYMAGHLPIVSSIELQLKAIITQNKIGINYQADSVDQLCEAIRFIKSNPHEAKAMGERGYQLLKDRFETEKVFEITEAHLKKIAGKN